MVGRSRFGTRRAGAQAQVQGRWSLTAGLFGEETAPLPSPERRRALAELLLERYGIVTREQVLAEGIKGGFAVLYDAFSSLETLGICRRGYFVEGLGGAQFALPGAVERLRAGRTGPAGDASERGRTLVIAAADPAQPYGAALPWPKREERQEHGRRPARVAGAYVVMVEQEPVLYVERSGRGLITLVPSAAPSTGVSGSPPSAGREGEPLLPALAALAAKEPVQAALRALAEAVHAGRVGKLSLERIDGEPAVGSRWESVLAEYGFRAGPRRLTLSA